MIEKLKKAEKAIGNWRDEHFKESQTLVLATGIVAGVIGLSATKKVVWIPCLLAEMACVAFESCESDLIPDFINDDDPIGII